MPGLIGSLVFFDAIFLIIFLVMMGYSWDSDVLNDLGSSFLTSPNLWHPLRWVFRIGFFVFLGALCFSSLYVEYNTGISTVLMMSADGEIKMGSNFCDTDCVSVRDEYKIDNYVPLEGCAFRYKSVAEIDFENLPRLASHFHFVDRESPMEISESDYVLRPIFYKVIKMTDLMLIAKYRGVPCEQIKMAIIAGDVYGDLNVGLKEIGFRVSGVPEVSWE